MTLSALPPEFSELRPRLKMLLEMHRAAVTDQERAVLVDLFEDTFLATAWHVAQDLLENGWEPGYAAAAPPERRAAPMRANLRLVGEDENAA